MRKLLWIYLVPLCTSCSAPKPINLTAPYFECDQYAVFEYVHGASVNPTYLSVVYFLDKNDVLPIVEKDIYSLVFEESNQAQFLEDSKEIDEKSFQVFRSSPSFWALSILPSAFYFHYLVENENQQYDYRFFRSPVTKTQFEAVAEDFRPLYEGQYQKYHSTMSLI